MTGLFLCEAIEEIKEKMKTVKHKLLVLSGKGGVGKSTFSAQLAHGLAEDDAKQVCGVLFFGKSLLNATELCCNERIGQGDSYFLLLLSCQQERTVAEMT